jgi:DNA-directed RNA polymerase subunit RPC12/RpoP/macrodomain Ter protein organizer (MatP/YcbG family)
VIKFHCLNCGQKLAVSEDGVGAVVSCTNCTERIVVPPYSIPRFFPTERRIRSFGTPVAGGPVPKRSIDSGLELMRPAPHSVENVPATVRSALIPHLARMMMNRLVQALFAQREGLIDTQTEATRRMAVLEERITQAQENVQKKIAGYENRIAELERQLITKEEEKRELMRANFQLAKKALEAENAPGHSRVNLRDAGFLLRA